MKLNPKGVKFCPGCSKKKLSLKKAPDLVIKLEEKQETTKTVTILPKIKKKKTERGLF